MPLGMRRRYQARQGAGVTGADFSATALERLRDLAARCGVEMDTVEADSRDLPVLYTLLVSADLA